jgi:hypothetical protein
VTVTQLFVPSNVRAFPFFPLVVQVGLLRVPVRLFADASAVVVPLPSLKPYAATRPSPVGVGANVAVALFAASTVTTHVPVPVHAPLQPLKREPVDGVAVRVTVVPDAIVALQALPQSIPVGEEVTVPLPVPLLVTVRLWVTWLAWIANVAVTLRAVVMLTVHVPVPLQPAPLQPVKVAPVPAAGVRVTTVPEAYEALHVAPQALMPAGADVTVPAPVPALVTVRA